MAKNGEEQGIPSPGAAQPSGKGAGKRNWVAGALGPALKLWLRSQIDSSARLEVAVGSETGAGASLSGRQMLAGRIPLVRVEADDVVYKGLHLGQLKLAGRDIRMNLGQAVRGKPLKLLAPIAVDLELCMTEAQLNRSLTSPLLAPQLGEWLDLLRSLLVEAEPNPAQQLSQPQIALAGGERDINLGTERLGLQVYCVASPDGAPPEEDSLGGACPNESHPSDSDGKPEPLAIETALTVRNGNLLKLRKPCWSQTPPPGFQSDLSSLAMMPLKLGNDVVIERIAIAAGQLSLVGRLTVQP